MGASKQWEQNTISMAKCIAGEHLEQVQVVEKRVKVVIRVRGNRDRDCIRVHDSDVLLES